MLICRFSISLFLFLLFILPNVGLLLKPPGIYNPNAHWPDACREANRLWTRYSSAGFPECVISTISLPPSDTTQDRKQTNNIHPVPGWKLIFLNPPGIELRLPGWKAGTLPTRPRRWASIFLIFRKPTALILEVKNEFYFPGHLPRE